MLALSRVLQLRVLCEVRGTLHGHTRPCVHRDQALTLGCAIKRRAVWEWTQVKIINSSLRATWLLTPAPGKVWLCNLKADKLLLKCHPAK